MDGGIRTVCCRGGVGDYREVEVRPNTDFALEPNLAAHQFRELLADREAQACSPVSTRRRCIDLCERQEELRAASIGDSDAGIPNRKMQLPTRDVSAILRSYRPCRCAGLRTWCSTHRHKHLAFLGEFDRVAQDIDQ